MVALTSLKKYTPLLFMPFVAMIGFIMPLLPLCGLICAPTKEKTGKKWGGVLFNVFWCKEIRKSLFKSIFLHEIRLN